MPEQTPGPAVFRVGIMCNGRSFPAWQAKVIESLLDLDNVEIDLLIVRKGASGARSRRLSALLRDWRHLLWSLYNKGFVERRSLASKSVDLTERLVDVDEIVCVPLSVGKFGEKLSEADVKDIGRRGLDVILRFGFGILKGEVLDSARFGIWSFHHGDERLYRGQPPGFWEVHERSPVVGVILQRITERLDGGTVLHRGTFRSTLHSYRRTRDELFLGAADFVSIEIRRILLGHTDTADAAPSTTTAPLRRSPTNGVMMLFLARQMTSFVTSQWRGLTTASKWSVGIIEQPIADLLDRRPMDVDWVPEQGKDRYFADPFPDPSGRSDIVMFEDFDHAGRRGVISAVDMRTDRRARRVLDTGVHASYPYLFEAEGVIYCAPETHQAMGVRLYRATDFPDKWDLEATILEGTPVLDPTLFRHEDRWWLMCTHEGPHANDKLHAYWAETLHGPWQPHALDPVKTDVTSSRPAGTPFVSEGALHRPAQDSSRSYGGSVTINRVDVLTPTEFAETAVARITPPDRRYPDGIHTISGAGGRTVIDGRRDLFNLSSFRHELAGRLRKLGRG